jgi:hypothetical protein
MAFNINSFLSQGLIGGGVRPSLFDVVIIFPALASNNNSAASVTSSPTGRLQFTCSATSIPEATVGSIPVSYFGRKIKLAGDRVYQDWTVSIMNDEDYVVRDALESWSFLINSPVGNIRSTSDISQFIAGSNNNSYKQDAYITSYKKDGSILATYNMIGIYPTTVQAMGVDWSTNDQIQQYQVQFAYDYWMPANTPVQSNSYQASQIV